MWSVEYLPAAADEEAALPVGGYVTAAGQRVVIVRIFVKKTQNTPQRELELARQRAKEVK